MRLQREVGGLAQLAASHLVDVGIDRLADEDRDQRRDDPGDGDHEHQLEQREAALAGSREAARVHQPIAAGEWRRR